MLDFQDLYDIYAADIYQFAIWMTGDSYEAEDITSETIIRAWARKNKIRTETLKAYLLTIARNTYLEKHRKRKRHIDLDDAYPDPSPGPEKVFEAQQKILNLQRFLAAMPEIDRSAFIMRFQHELPYAEIARALDLSLTTAKVKVHRVRKKLLITFLDQEAT